MKFLRFQRAEDFAEEVVEAVLAVNDDAQIVALLAAEADAAAQTGNHLRRGAQLRQVAIIAA